MRATWAAPVSLTGGGGKARGGGGAGGMRDYVVTGHITLPDPVPAPPEPVAAGWSPPTSTPHRRRAEQDVSYDSANQVRPTERCSLRQRQEQGQKDTETVEKLPGKYEYWIKRRVSGVGVTRNPLDPPQTESLHA
jgi:hypothetical protein